MPTVPRRPRRGFMKEVSEERIVQLIVLIWLSSVIVYVKLPSSIFFNLKIYIT
jgi:hypothetical protein